MVMGGQRRHSVVCGLARQRFWQISGKACIVAHVLARLMLDGLMLADGFQSSG
jgi:hypothetical protein